MNLPEILVILILIAAGLAVVVGIAALVMRFVSRKRSGGS